MTLPPIVRLTPEWAEFVDRLPESGMGYTKVRVRLRDGRELAPVTVIGSVLVAQIGNDPHAPIPFTIEDIAAIERL